MMRFRLLQAAAAPRRERRGRGGLRRELGLHRADESIGQVPIQEPAVKGRPVELAGPDDIRPVKGPAQEAGNRGAEFITLFSGEDVAQEQADKAQEIFSGHCPDAELSVLPGGQPVYYYIISIE